MLSRQPHTKASIELQRRLIHALLTFHEESELSSERLLQATRAIVGLTIVLERFRGSRPETQATPASAGGLVAETDRSQSPSSHESRATTAEPSPHAPLGSQHEDKPGGQRYLNEKEWA